MLLFERLASVYRSLLPLLICALLVSACAGDKNEKGAGEAANKPSNPMDTLATPQEMVPVVVPVPVKPDRDDNGAPLPSEPKPEPKPIKPIPPVPPLPEEPSPSDPVPQEPIPQGPKPEPRPEPRPQPRPQPQPPPPGGTWQQSLLAAQRRAMNAQLTCEGGRCHQSVGLVTIVNKEENGWGAGQCTGSLIAPDVVATNGHCIPMDIKDAGAD